MGYTYVPGDIRDEVRKVVDKMNDMALHNFANTLLRNPNSNLLPSFEKKAKATTFVWDVINDLLYGNDGD